MDNKYKKLVNTLPKESEDLWFEYNLAVNKIIQENQQLHNKIDKAIDYINGAWEMGCYTKTVALYSEELEELLEILKDSDVDE